MKKIIFTPLHMMSCLIISAIFLISVPVVSQTIKTNWVGSYEFFDAERGGPKNQPNNFVTYTLIVSQSGDRLAARFTADGAQIADDYECRVETAADSIKIFFVKDLGGMESNKAAPLTTGDLIFTLTRTVIGRKTRYLFGKGKYEIYPLAAPLKTKIYFDRKK